MGIEEIEEFIADVRCKFINHRVTFKQCDNQKIWWFEESKNQNSAKIISNNKSIEIQSTYGHCLIEHFSGNAFQWLIREINKPIELLSTLRFGGLSNDENQCQWVLAQLKYFIDRCAESPLYDQFMSDPPEEIEG